MDRSGACPVPALSPEAFDDPFEEDAGVSRAAPSPPPYERLHRSLPRLDGRPGAWNLDYAPVSAGATEKTSFHAAPAGYRYTGIVWEAGPRFPYGDGEDCRDVMAVADEGRAVRICADHNACLPGRTGVPWPDGRENRYNSD